MIAGILYIFILVFFKIQKSSCDSAINECENNGFIGKWICIRNEENTFNVTFDCILNQQKVCSFISIFQN